MHVVLTHSTTQSTREEGTRSLVELIEFARVEWDRYKRTRRRTMRDLKVPPHITFVVVDGEVYSLGSRRALWFKPNPPGYDENCFYVSEVTNDAGLTFQLHFVFNDDAAENQPTVRAREVMPRRGRLTHGASGPLVRE